MFLQLLLLYYCRLSEHKVTALPDPRVGNSRKTEDTFRVWLLYLIVHAFEDGSLLMTYDVSLVGP